MRIAATTSDVQVTTDQQIVILSFAQVASGASKLSAVASRIEALKDSIRRHQPGEDVIAKAHKLGKQSKPVISLNFDEDAYSAYMEDYSESELDSEDDPGADKQH